MTQCTKLVIAVVALLMLATTEAAIIGPVAALPGGATFVSDGGNPGGAGGITFTMSADDPGQFTALYWGPTDDLFVPGAGIGSAMDGAIDSPGESMTWTSLSATEATWLGSTTVNTQSSGVQNVETRFVATIVSGATGWTQGGPLGLADPVATPVAATFTDPATAFVVNLIFEARTAGSGGAWTPFFDYFDPITGPGEDGNALTSFQGGIAYSPIPLPGAVWFLGSALGLLGWIRARSTQSPIR